jgi:two-component sensor histidine kinase
MRSIFAENASERLPATEAAPPFRDCHSNPGPSLDLLVRELQHRIRNLLTVVQCFVTQTECETSEEYRTALMSRIAGLSDAYELIERSGTQRTKLAEVLEQTLKPYVSVKSNRVHACGPDLELEPGLALSLHMIFHELATNATKYGSLACPFGKIEIFWDSAPTTDGCSLALQWREYGGPKVRKPDRKGFGLRLVTKVLKNAQVDLDFDSSGLACRMLIDVVEPQVP